MRWIGNWPLAVRRVSSPVIDKGGAHGRGRCQRVRAGRLRGRHGRGRASQNRSGCGERQDSGDEDGSPNAHDLSMASTKVSGLPQRVVGLARHI